MWRKPTEPKPSSQAPNTPAAAPVKETTGQEPKSAEVLSSSSAAAAIPANEAGKDKAIKAAAPTSPATVAPSSAITEAPVSAPAATKPAAPQSAPERREPRAEGRSFSTINAGLKIRGEIFGDTDLFVDGQVQGKIRMENARVTVGPNGRVQADIEAREIVIEGTLDGGLKASESVRLGDASRVQGSVVSPNIAISDGARFRGTVEMVRAGVSDSSASAAKAAAGTASTPAKGSEMARVASASGESE